MRKSSPRSSHDTVLTAKLLRARNSPFFGLGPSRRVGRSSGAHARPRTDSSFDLVHRVRQCRCRRGFAGSGRGGALAALIDDGVRMRNDRAPVELPLPIPPPHSPPLAPRHRQTGLAIHLTPQTETTMRGRIVSDNLSRVAAETEILGYHPWRSRRLPAGDVEPAGSHRRGCGQSPPTGLAPAPAPSAVTHVGDCVAHFCSLRAST